MKEAYLIIMIILTIITVGCLVVTLVNCINSVLEYKNYRKNIIKQFDDNSNRNVVNKLNDMCKDNKRAIALECTGCNHVAFDVIDVTEDPNDTIYFRQCNICHKTIEHKYLNF